MGQQKSIDFIIQSGKNKTHIQCLKTLLNDNTIPVYSYIVFGNGCELKNITLTRNSCHVIYERYLVQDISENAKLCGKCLSDEKIATLYAFEQFHWCIR